MKLRPLSPGTEALARAPVPGGVLTSTSPRTGSALNLRPRIGGPGAAAATVKLRRAALGSSVDAGLASTLPAASIERTRNVCEPGLSAGRVRGEAHGSQTPS